ncbi:Disrupted in renal carcinoma protein 2 [Liparis tanakae]|uniref:Disrupted in renal carcinoma protein 2 n=1 Tax=Liparis tanakae TaxID=230148 RepID=A0A4Z2EV77_9TELE|nr:Disrupted in renal carcinoma protein 2 [Liparis tanakae]
MGAAGSSSEAEREPLLVPPPQAADVHAPPAHGRVYGRRWLVLGLFSLLGLLQGAVWNFWGPIQSSAARAFGFGRADIALLVLWGPLGFVPWLLFMWLLDKKAAWGGLKQCDVIDNNKECQHGGVPTTTRQLTQDQLSVVRALFTSPLLFLTGSPDPSAGHLTPQRVT